MYFLAPKLSQGFVLLYWKLTMQGGDVGVGQRKRSQDRLGDEFLLGSVTQQQSSPHPHLAPLPKALSHRLGL